MKIVIFLLLITALLLASCGQKDSAQQNSTDYTIVAEPSIKVGDPVPVPTDTVILTLEGKIGTTNVDGRLDFDMQTLERLGLITYQVDDPDVKRETTYTGVLLTRVLEVAKIDPGATELATTALNDYQITIPLDVLQWPVMIATMRDGERMTIEEKGPLEIVFPNKQYNIEPILHNPMWVWNLRHVKVQ